MTTWTQSGSTTQTWTDTAAPGYVQPGYVSAGYVSGASHYDPSSPAGQTWTEVPAA